MPKLKYSTSTLQALHEKALQLLELIAHCEKSQEWNLKDAAKFRLVPHLNHVANQHTKEAWRCRKIANYLKGRYNNFLLRIIPTPAAP